MPDFRALCAELHAAVQLYTGQNPAAAGIPANELVARLMGAMANTAAALAQPEPQGPSEAELKTFACNWWHSFGFVKNKATCTWVIDQIAPEHFVDFSRDLLARWGRPAIEPVPVSERLPGPEDCDAEGCCWLHKPHPATPETPEWKLIPTRYASTIYGTTHWLPHWALPVPEVEGEQ